MEYIVTSWCNMLIIILFIQSQSWPVLGNTGVLWLWPAYKQWEFWAILAKLRPSDFEPYSSCLSKRGDVTKTKKSHHLNFYTLFFCYWVALCLMLFWVMELRGGGFDHIPQRFSAIFHVLGDVLSSCTRTVKPRQRGSFHKSLNEKGW